MCGRYYIEDSEDAVREMHEIITEINRKYYGTPKGEAMRTGEIFPTNHAPVITAGGPDVMRWGFQLSGRPQAIINARSETANEKPLFKNALDRRRVAIPTSGFFEWTHIGKKAKDKFIFSLAGEDMLYLAGMHSNFELPDGSRQDCFTILTTAANDSMTPYHDRMPVYVQASEIDAWVNDGGATDDIIHRPQPALLAVLADPAKREPEQTSLF